MIDNQGKDIAIDMAKIEQQISQMQTQLNKRSPLMDQENEQSGPKLSYPTMESIEDRVLELVQQKLQETQIPANINQSPSHNKSMSPREVSISYQQDMKYLTNKVDQFEQHLSQMSILVNQLRVDKLSQSQKSTSNSKQRQKDEMHLQTRKELKAFESKLNSKWTGKLTNVVDKLG